MAEHWTQQRAYVCWSQRCIAAHLRAVKVTLQVDGQAALTKSANHHHQGYMHNEGCRPEYLYVHFWVLGKEKSREMIDTEHFRRKPMMSKT